MDNEALYRQLRVLADSMPALPVSSVTPTYSAKAYQWLGRLEALLAAAGNTADLAALQQAVKYLVNPLRTTRVEALNTIQSTLFRALGELELRVPGASSGSFVAVGNAYDAIRALDEIMKSASKELLIVDPYMDEIVLSDAAILANEHVSLRLLSDAATVKPSLKPMVTAWTAQHGAARPIEVRLAPPRTLHDRLILVDGKTVWILTQSIKDLAKRSPATFTTVAAETASLKIPAYECIWQNSSPS